eukprot:TRINITY_DN6476_c0_g1_i1.p1 TRINITY_DN6476_c0_g1~~TRINITY_DN6476_c0_g1_i1.p1  ORF type:complete len:167 (-),score=22.75 TRINITY_DN6476_c0_g1_i1:1-501(-)
MGEIIDVFMDPSPDLVYQFNLLGEHYRLSGNEDGKIIQNIQEFYEELLEIIQKQKVVIPHINFERKYDTFEIQNYYKKLLEIGQSLSTVKCSALQELQLLSQLHKQADHILCCLLYTSDAADDTPCVDLGGRRIIKKKKKQNQYNIKQKSKKVLRTCLNTKYNMES